MSKIKVRFLEAGEWGDEPGKPVFAVKANEVVEVTARLAKIATDAGKATFLGKGQIDLASDEDAEKFANLIDREEAVKERETGAAELEANLVDREDAVTAAETKIVDRENDAAELDQSLDNDKVELDKRKELLDEREEALIEREEALANPKPGPKGKGKTGPKDKAET